MKNKVNNIQDLIEILGEEKVNRLFIEYFIILAGSKLTLPEEFENVDLTGIE